MNTVSDCVSDLLFIYLSTILTIYDHFMLMIMIMLSQKVACPCQSQLRLFSYELPWQTHFQLPCCSYGRLAGWLRLAWWLIFREIDGGAAFGEPCYDCNRCSGWISTNHFFLWVRIGGIGDGYNEARQEEHQQEQQQQ